MYTVYKVTNIINNKIYIGVHLDKSDTMDNYLGSGSTIRKAVAKYGRRNFDKVILHKVECEELAYFIEELVVTIDEVNNPNYYNNKLGGIGGSDGSMFNTPEARKKNIESIKYNKELNGGYMGDNLHTPESKLKSRESLVAIYGKSYTHLNNSNSKIKRFNTNTLKYNNKYGNINSESSKMKSLETRKSRYGDGFGGCRTPKSINKITLVKRLNRLKSNVEFAKSYELTNSNYELVTIGNLLHLEDILGVRCSYLIHKVGKLNTFNKKSKWYGYSINICSSTTKLESIDS